MAELLMPSLGADMEAGTLVAWRKHPGDRIERGEVVAEVETDKGIIEVESFVSGTIERLLVEPGQRVPVGTLLAALRDEGAPAESRAAPSPGPAAPITPPVAPPAAAPAPTAASAPAASAPAASAVSVPVVEVPVVPQASLPSLPEAQQAALADLPPDTLREREARSSPLARRRARELGLDLGLVRGTGPGGAITIGDVERVAEARSTADADRGARMRRAIAAAVSRSKREIPHFYLGTTVDMGPSLAWLTRENEGRPVDRRVLPGVLFLKAVALALRQTPELNARTVGDSAPPLGDINVGVALSLRGGGLVAPAIHGVDRLDLDALMAALQDVAQRARAGALRSSEMSDGTITVTSLGDRGVETVLPVIFPPQVAVVGVGKIVERPWVVSGAVVPRPVANVTLAVDHRISDGHQASRLLLAIESLLLNPEKL